MSHTACKDEFRSNIRSHSWSVFSFFILSGGVRIQSTTTSYLKHVLIITAFENKSGNTVVEHDATVPNGYAVTLTFYKSIFRTSAVSSTKFASIRIFSSWLLVLEIFIIYIYSHFFFPALDKPWSQVPPFLPPVLSFDFYCAKGSAIPLLVDFRRVLQAHALAISASQFVRKQKSQRVFTSMHSVLLELTKLTYTRLEDKLRSHRGDRNILV